MFDFLRLFSHTIAAHHRCTVVRPMRRSVREWTRRSAIAYRPRCRVL